MNTEAGSLKSIWTNVDGLRMHARANRKETYGVPVVLVHGLVVSSRYMIPTAVRLARGCPVYTPDLPGFGKSEHPARPLDLPQLADSLAGWMRAVGIEHAALLGNSFGCQVIADLALRHPRLVDRMVLVGPTIDRHARSLPAQIRRLLAAGLHDNPTLVGVQARDILSAGIRETLRTTQVALADRIEDKLPAIDVPALIVRGERDPIAPAAWCAELSRRLPRGQLLEIPGGHALNYSHPDRLIAAVLPFLEIEEPHSFAR